MKHPKIISQTTGRREFLSKLSAAAALGFIGPVAGSDGTSPVDNSNNLRQSNTLMPSIALGPYRISRLICGSNPILGYSYLGSHTDRQMKEYFTNERTLEFLEKCEKAGISAHQSSSRVEYLSELRRKGSKLKIICLHSDREKIREAVETAKPIAMVHHGGVSDRLFASGNSEVVRDYVRAVKDLGLLAGVSAHNPDVIKQIADEGWDVDFFMACFYFLTRNEIGNAATLPVGSYHFFRNDPEVMTSVIRQVEQPCLAFKILGAGRHCSGQEQVRNAFRYAFENIKPNDGVIVGMFPWCFDEIEADVKYVQELGTTSSLNR